MTPAERPRLPRARQRLGKYHLQRRLGDGGSATVFEATDQISGIRVALKVFHRAADKAHLAEFQREARLIAKMDHPNIVPMWNADVIDGRLVAAFPLADHCLEDRMRHRIGMRSFVAYARQMLEGVAHAHTHGIVHCDLKPGNFLLFADDLVRLGDFGISRMARRTVRVSGSGTVGYIAPEQAMGRASPRSDVFSLGLILFQMLTATLPEWPFEWPLPGTDKLRRKVPANFVQFLEKATAVDPAERFADGRMMLRRFVELEPEVLRFDSSRLRRARRTRGGRR